MRTAGSKYVHRGLRCGNFAQIGPTKFCSQSVAKSAAQSTTFRPSSGGNTAYKCLYLLDFPKLLFSWVFSDPTHSLPGPIIGKLANQEANYWQQQTPIRRINRRLAGSSWSKFR